MMVKLTYILGCQLELCLPYIWLSNIWETKGKVVDHFNRTISSLISCRILIKSVDGHNLCKPFLNLALKKCWIGAQMSWWKYKLIVCCKRAYKQYMLIWHSWKYLTPVGQRVCFGAVRLHRLGKPRFCAHLQL